MFSGAELSEIFKGIYSPIFDTLKSVLNVAGSISLISLVLFIGIFIFKYPFIFKRNKYYYLKRVKIKFKYYDLMRWLIIDILTMKRTKKIFNRYGFTVFCGRQGSGKTISMIKYLFDIKERFPDCLIVTNFACSIATHQMKDWRDLFEIRNDTKGVVFAIDEIHSEYSSASWKDFPESLLSEISQQRKQRIKIVATAQVFDRIAKPIREQCFSVCDCKTFLNRFTMYKEYDVVDYADVGKKTNKPRPLSRLRYVQSDKLRQSYDTYEKIERLERSDFIARSER